MPLYTSVNQDRSSFSILLTRRQILAVVAYAIEHSAAGRALNSYLETGALRAYLENPDDEDRRIAATTRIVRALGRMEPRVRHDVEGLRDLTESFITNALLRARRRAIRRTGASAASARAIVDELTAVIDAAAAADVLQRHIAAVTGRRPNEVDSASADGFAEIGSAEGGTYTAVGNASGSGSGESEDTPAAAVLDKIAIQKLRIRQMRVYQKDNFRIQKSRSQRVGPEKEYEQVDEDD